MKYCIHCVYFRKDAKYRWLYFIPIIGRYLLYQELNERGPTIEFGKCILAEQKLDNFRRRSSNLSPGFDRKKVNFQFASTMREGECGPDAVFFESLGSAKYDYMG